MNLEEICRKSKQDREYFSARLKQQLANIEKHGKDINALIRQYVNSNSLPEALDGPLFGLTFTVKDSIAVAGQPMTAGLNPPLVNRCESDAPIVAKLRKLGALLIGSTNLDELCLSATGQNPSYGNVTNPKFRDYATLGSSSGAAASVAAGFCDFAIGSDFGGSVRLPAAACGIAGIKLTPNILDRTGIVGFDDTMDGPGILASTLEDVSFVARTLLPTPGQALEKLHFLIPSRAELAELPLPIKESFEWSVGSLCEKFEVSQVAVDFSFKNFNTSRRFYVSKVILDKALQMGLQKERFPRALSGIIRLLETAQDSEVQAALVEFLAFRERAQSELNQQSIFLTPTLGAMPPKRCVDGGFERIGASIWQFTTLANALGACGLTFTSRPDGGPETGLQLIGSAGFDLEALKVAQELRDKLANN